MKKIFTLLFATIVAFTLVACGPKKANNDLKVAAYLGGYGEKWLHDMARAFEAENPGVKVEVEANPELAADIPNRLENGSKDDIFFSHGIAWELQAVQGRIEPLDDLLQQEVENGIKLIDKIDSSLLETAKFAGKTYKLPWTKGVGGLVYNAKMFRENNWEVPTTYDELLALADTINEANLPVPGASSRHTVKPFVWSQETYYWDYLVFDWWAQIDGIEFFKNYNKVESPDMFNPGQYPGLEKALTAWTDLVAKNPNYSVEDSVGKQYMAAQMDFLNGYAAMIPNAQWLESEMSENIDPSKVEMKMMPAPMLSEAKKDANGNPIRVNYTVGAGDSIIIPKKAPNKELAKKFLLFLAKDDTIKSFTETTRGVLLAMDYSNVDFTNSKLSDFTRSVIEINNTSQKFNLYSNSLMVLEGKVSTEWPPQKLQHYASIFNHYNVREYLQDPAAFLAAGKGFNVHEVFTSAYNEITSNWDKWKNEIVE